MSPRGRRAAKRHAAVTNGEEAGGSRPLLVVRPSKQSPAIRTQQGELERMAREMRIVTTVYQSTRVTLVGENPRSVAEPDGTERRRSLVPECASEPRTRHRDRPSSRGSRSERACPDAAAHDLSSPVRGAQGGVCVARKRERRQPGPSGVRRIAHRTRMYRRERSSCLAPPRVRHTRRLDRAAGTIASRWLLPALRPRRSAHR